MTEPTPRRDDYTRGDVVTMTGASVPQVKRLLRASVLKKKARGTGNYLGFTLDDALRIAVAKELLRVGVQAESIHSLFQFIEKDWPRLRQPRVRVDGAALVLVLRPHGVRSGAGAAYLTTTADAIAQLRSKQTVVVIDVNALIQQLEDRTGERYTDE